MLFEGIELCKRIGNKRLWGDSLGTAGVALHYQAKFMAATKIFLELYTLGTQSDNVEHQAEALTGQANSYLRLGQIEKSINLLNNSRSLWNP